METLYISFWKIGLDNLPLGDLTHQLLTAEEAASLIRRAEKRQCVAGEDILAPYKQKEREHYRELCGILTRKYNIPLRLEEFALTDDEGISTIFPLSLIQVSHENPLLVVTANFILGEIDKANARPVFRLAADDVRFHLMTKPKTELNRLVLE